jgi:hypothetical protein
MYKTLSIFNNENLPSFYFMFSFPYLLILLSIYMIDDARLMKIDIELVTSYYRFVMIFFAWLNRFSNKKYDDYILDAYK